MYSKAIQAVPKGWNLFKHAVSMVSSNLAQAVRISLPWIILIVALVLGGAFLFRKMVATESPPMQTFATFGVFGVIVAVIIIGSIIAIQWHRYILLDELPRGYFKGWRKLNYWGYTKQILKVSLYLIVISYFGSVLIALVTPEETQFLTPVILSVVLSFVYLRMSIGFTAIAMGKTGLSTGASWRISKDFREVLFVNAVLLALLNALPRFLSFALTGPEFLSFIPDLMSLATMWFSMMVGLSLLTTLYGHYIEKRAI